ncbi:uncharacterized protein LOC119103521 [Pollicipes pollicipes]|uniref:uncharacterized protein LOC119103521 n=1 Tax=Pollicipes pollicipes TaxID=41117 RepID=UPI0018854558|nr:uncharacterized protein LOC119103521 [Pollicipes pollicipes]
MSLSSQYLDELSRRYKKQVEEMQKTFNKTIAALEVTAHDAETRDELQQEMIRSLQGQILNLTRVVAGVVAEKESITWTLVQRHLVLMLAELLMLALAFALLARRPAALARAQPARSARQPVLRRNKSVGGARRPAAGQPAAGKHRRRPSDEVVNISGTYRDLLIAEGQAPAARRGRHPGRVARSYSTWSLSSEEDEAPTEVAVPGVGVLFASSPAVAYVDRRGAAGRAATSNPYSALCRLENGDGGGRLTNGYAPPSPPPPPPAAPGPWCGGPRRRDRDRDREGRDRPADGRPKPRDERRRVKKKLQVV